MTTHAHYSARILWSDEDDGYVASIPELVGVSAFGPTLQAALSELHVARELWLEEVAASEASPPPPMTLSHRSGQFRVRLPRSLHDWLVERADIEGVSLNTLVVQLLSDARGGISPTVRLRDPEPRVTPVTDATDLTPRPR